MSGTGTRSGPAGATAPARRKARRQASGASARRLREEKKGKRKKKPRGIRAAPGLSGRLLAEPLAAVGLDRDPARLQRLGKLAHQVDVQQPLVERRARHLDVVG